MIILKFEGFIHEKSNTQFYCHKRILKNVLNSFKIIFPLAGFMLVKSSNNSLSEQQTWLGIFLIV